MIRIPTWATFAALTILMGVGAAWSFLIPPAAGFNDEQLARIVVFHLPCAFAATIFMVWGSAAALAFLKTRKPVWDMRTEAAMELAWLLSGLTMLTGILFSKTQWGAWWQWDPRQTSFLLVVLVLSAYLALRLAYQDEEKRAAVSAAYVGASIVPNLFLVFVLPRLMLSFHPSDTVARGGFDRPYWTAILGVFAMLAAACAGLYSLRVRAALLVAASWEKPDGELDADRGGAAPTGVVRPIAVPDAGDAKGESG